MGEETLNLIKKGAEASLFSGDWEGRRVVSKVRLTKNYRPFQLDQTIRHYRTVHEPQLMHEAKRAGVPTPIIFLVDVEKATIVMEYVEGTQIKLILNTASGEQRDELCFRIGELVAKLHKHGIVHGDLTTSNMILASDGRIFFLDFGLGDKSSELEAQGVDLHLLKRALQSTHFEVAHESFNAVLKGYASVLGEEVECKMLEKLREIEKRGRYVAERKVDQGGKTAEL